MKKSSTLTPLKVFVVYFCFLSSLTFSKDITRRSLNEGQLILEDIPVINQPLKQQIQQYQSIRQGLFGDWSLDGESLYITTRFGNVSQIHRVASPHGAREQLTFFKEPVGSIVQNPVNNLIAFTMDKGGNENTQIYTLDLKGKTKLLTDGKSLNNLMRWSNDGQWMAYKSTRRDGKSNDIWLMDINNSDSAKIILTAGGDGSWWIPIAWSKDDKSLLVQQLISVNQSLIYLLDIKTGKKKLLQGNLEAPSYNAALAFTQNDNQYFFITDQYDDFKKLAVADIQQPNKSRVITKDINWDVDNFAINSDSSRAAFSINKAGLSKLYLLNPKTREYTTVNNLPSGLISRLHFNPIYNQLGMNLNTTQSPNDAYVLALGKDPFDYDAITQWTKSEVGFLDTRQFTEPELFSYTSFDKRTISAFIYRPASNDNQPKPVIIDIHGGPESQFRPGFSITYPLLMQTLGATIIAPNVRGSSGYGKTFLDLDNGYLREDAVRDIGSLLDWIETQPDLDKNRVVVMGGSYGGYMVLASAIHYSHRLKAGVNRFGISNFVTFLENTQDYRKDIRRAEYGDERDADMRNCLETISPNRHADKINIPLLIIQGQNDPRVPVTESEQMVSTLRAENKIVWYMNALNEGHGYRKKVNRDTLLEVITLFLKEYL